MKRVAVQYVLRQGANIEAAIAEVLQSKLAHPSSSSIFRVLLTNVELAKSLSKNMNEDDNRNRVSDASGWFNQKVWIHSFNNHAHT